LAAKGKVVWISGPAVKADGMSEVKMAETVSVGEDHLVGEVIKITGDVAFIQVYETTSGIRPGEPVVGTGMPLSVTLGPGVMSQIYDGLQRPLTELAALSGPYIKRGVSSFSIPRNKKWRFIPRVRVGDRVEAGSVLGIVNETSTLEHRIMVPPDFHPGTIKAVEPEGDYDVEHEIAILENGEKRPLKMYHYWPVRRPRPYRSRIDPEIPLITGQRVLDTFFPLAKGGTAAIPGGFGTGKCVPAGTPVMLADGTLLPIDRIYETFSSGVETSGGKEVTVPVHGVSVLTFDGRGFSVRPATHVYRGTTDKLISLRTKSGRTVVVTPAHKLFRFDPSGSFEERPAGSLEPGDYIAVPRKIPTISSYQLLDPYEIQALVPDDDVKVAVARLIARMETQMGSRLALARALHISCNALIKYASGSNDPTTAFIRDLCALAGVERPPISKLTMKGRHDSLLVPSKVDERLAELMGLLLSSSTVAGGRVRFFSKDRALKERFSYLINSLFGLKCSEASHGALDGLIADSTVLARLLGALGCRGRRGSPVASVPSVIFRSPDEVVAAFLRGYYLGSGSFDDGKIEIHSASKPLVEGITYLLSKLGVLYSIAADTGEGLKLIIDGSREVENFVSSVFLGDLFGETPKVTEAEERCPSKSRSAAEGLVPLDPALLAALFRPGAVNDRASLGDGTASTPLFNLTASVSTKDTTGAASKLQDLGEALKWVVIEEVEQVRELKGRQPVYDLTVPGTHNFVGGHHPIILHNTVTLHQIASWADTKVVVYVGCGERGNEMTEVLIHFPELKDPYSGKPLMERTVLVANTSNMPVAAREASIYTGATLAEYYRDMGYDVVMLADSTSRWAEALREISGRLEEMPAEEGYPSYLATRLAEFYERAGRVNAMGSPARVGSISLIGAVSPSGADFTEPVTTHTMRFIRTFWALDTKLAYSRHYPAINWMTSYSGFLDKVSKWWTSNVDKEWFQLRQDAYGILQREDTLKEIVRLLGPEVLPDEEKLVLDVARIIKVGFLQQTAYDPIDSYTNPKRQVALLRLMVEFYRHASAALKEGVSLQAIRAMPIISSLMRARFEVRDDELFKLDGLMAEMDSAFKAVSTQGVTQVAV